MKKLIASAASLTLAATILAGSASAASPLDFLKEFSWKNLFCQSQQAEQSQTEKALALINTFATGDTKTARSLLADGYIQHNLAYGTGADAFVGSVEYLASAPVKTTVQNIRAFEDGDKVFLQTMPPMGVAPSRSARPCREPTRTLWKSSTPSRSTTPFLTGARAASPPSS